MTDTDSTPETDTATAGGHRRLLSRDERQRSILDAAAETFAAGGYEATTMAEVADAAGISKVHLYHRVDSKEALYRSVLERTQADMAEEWEARAGQRGRGVLAHLAVARRDPHGYRLLWAHAGREAAFAAYAAEIRSWVVGIADAELGGRMDADFRRWADEVTVTLLVEATIGWLDFGRPELDEVYVERTTNAIAAFIRGAGGS